MLISIIVAVMCCFSAPQIDTAYATDNVVEINSATSKTLHEVFGEIMSDTIIRLTGDIEIYQDAVAVNDGSTLINVTVDMNGKTITYRYSGFENGDTAKPINLESGTAMTFSGKYNITVIGGGNIACVATYSANGIEKRGEEKLTVNDGVSIEVSSSAKRSSSRPIGIFVGSNNQAVINNVKIKAVGNSVVDPYGIYLDSTNCSLEVNYAEIE